MGENNGTGVSTFTEMLKELAAYSEDADTGTATHNEFIRLQKLGQRIMDAHNTGRTSHHQYKALSGAYFDIKDRFRVMLGLNRHPLTGSGKDKAAADPEQ